MNFSTSSFRGVRCHIDPPLAEPSLVSGSAGDADRLPSQAAKCQHRQTLSACPNGIPYESILSLNLRACHLSSDKCLIRDFHIQCLDEWPSDASGPPRT